MHQRAHTACAHTHTHAKALTHEHDLNLADSLSALSLPSFGVLKERVYDRRMARGREGEREIGREGGNVSHDG